MNNREAFEKWWDMERARVLSGRHDSRQACEIAWQAAKSQDAELIAELVAGIQNLKDVRGRHNTEIACNRLFDLLAKAKSRQS